MDYFYVAPAAGDGPGWFAKASVTQADDGRKRIRLDLFFGEPEGTAVLIWFANMSGESAYAPVGRLVDGHTVTNLDQIIGIKAHQYGINTDVFTSAFDRMADNAAG